MLTRKPRSKVPPLRFDWTFYLILGITVCWLGYNAWPTSEVRKEDVAKSAAMASSAETNIQAQQMDSLSAIPGIAYPKPVAGEQIVRHLAYTLSYNEDTEQANWVAYSFTDANVQGTFSRKEANTDFEPDYDIATGSASLDDYRGSGYDRGHLAPAGDMKFNKVTYQESFLLSNVSPQDHDLNSGLWRRIEEKIRKWQRRDGQLFVVTGPVLGTGRQTIGPNKVAVPAGFYKVVLDLESPDVKMIGFLVDNENSSQSMENFCVSVDKIEALTGQDFFYQLPDSLESALESIPNGRLWFAN
jgi:endonuclease G, mitochondrial